MKRLEVVMLAVGALAAMGAGDLGTVRVVAQSRPKLYRHGNPESALSPEVVQALTTATEAEPIMWVTQSPTPNVPRDEARTGPCLVGAGLSALVQSLLNPENYSWGGSLGFTFWNPQDPQPITYFGIVVHSVASGDAPIVLAVAPGFMSYRVVEPERTGSLVFNPTVFSELAATAFPEVAWPQEPWVPEPAKYRD